MRNILVLTVFAVLTANLSFAEVIEHPRNLKDEARIHEKAQRRWMWSAVALTAASFVDVSSSWGKLESNGMLRSSNGTFGAKGLGVKMGMVGGILVGQHFMAKKNPAMANAFSIANFGMAGVKVAVAARNYRIEAPPKYLLKQQ